MFYLRVLNVFLSIFKLLKHLGRIIEKKKLINVFHVPIKV